MRIVKGLVWGGVIGGVLFVLFVVLVDVGRIFHPTRELIDQGHGTVGTSTFEPGTQKNLCEYVLPEGFRWRSLMEEGKGGRGVQRMGTHIFTRSNSPEEMISLIKWPYHLKVDLDDVRIEEKERKRTWFLTGQPIKNYYEMTFQKKQEELFYTVLYYIPFFYARHVPAENRSLILRGMKLKEQKYLETDKTRIWVWYGDFQKLAFDKRQDHRWLHYIVEVIHFNEPKSGAVALIQNKDPQAKGVYVDDIEENGKVVRWEEIGEVPWDLQGATLFCLTTVKQGEKFDQAEFETFLKTINFNAKVFDPFVVMKHKGVKFQIK